MTDRKKPPKKSFRDLRDLKKSLPSAAHASAGQKKRKPTPSASPAERGASFEQEMARLGVVPGFQESAKDDDGPEKFACPPQEDSPPAEDFPDAGDISDDLLFISAFRNIDKVFTEEGSSVFSKSDPPAPPRKQRRKRILPEKSLDLHGLTRREALEKVGFFLENAAYHGLKTLLIITGRGHGSDGEAILRQAVEGYLASRPNPAVAAWERAPRRLGGEGALVVFLKEKI